MTEQNLNDKNKQPETTDYMKSVGQTWEWNQQTNQWIIKAKGELNLTGESS